MEVKKNWEALKTTVKYTKIGSAFVDLLQTRWLILIGACSALVFTLLYIRFLDWCAYWISWLTVVIVLAVLVGCGVGLLHYRATKISEYAYFSAFWLQIYAYTIFLIAGIYFVVMVCNFRSLRVATHVIETAADYFADTKRIVFVPIFYFFVAVISFVIWVAALVCVASIGDISVDPTIP